jgi:competence protein ComEC
MTASSAFSSLQSDLFSFHFRHRQLFLLVSACLAGHVSATWDWFSFSLWWMGGVVVFVGYLWLRYGYETALLTLCILSVFAVAHKTLSDTLHPQFPAHHLRQLSLPQQVTIEGWLFREPEQFSHRGRLYLETQHLWKDRERFPATGKILLTVRALSHVWQYGDVIRVTCTLRTPRNFATPGSFDYEGYLARHHLYLTAFLWDDQSIERIGNEGHPVQRRIEQLRRDIGEFFSAHLEPPVAAILRALIIGDEGLIDKKMRLEFARAGVTHVLSISGLHIALVAVTAYSGWWWLLGRSCTLLLMFSMPKIASILTLFPIFFYALLAGGNVATWRSVIMVGVYLVARVCDRQSDLYRSLAFAALVISYIWPGAVFDISFQLSFISVFSIVLGMEQVAARWNKWKSHPFFAVSEIRFRIFRWGLMYILVSAFALIGTAPLTAFHFNQISLAALVANLFVVPLLGSAAVILGLLTVIGFTFDTHLAMIFLWLAGFVVQVGNGVISWFAALPYASIAVVTPSVLELVLIYAVLLLICCRSLWSAQVYRLIMSFFLCGFLIDGAYWVSHRYYHHTLRLSFLDVGQGDAAVVELPDGQVMVVDGGGFASESFDTGEAILARFLRSQKIGHVDILVMSHPQLDHYGGLLYLVEHFSPRELWFNGEYGRGKQFVNFMKKVSRNGILLRPLCRDSLPPSSPLVSLQILHPPCTNNSLDTNNASLVLRFSYGTTSVLFTGDIEAEGESVLLSAEKILPSEILKVPHHGSRTSSSSEFIAAVAPTVAIASLGANNRFHFPADEVVQRYQRHGSRWLRTDQAGTVTVISDGRRYSLFTMATDSLSSIGSHHQFRFP